MNIVTIANIIPNIISISQCIVKYITDTITEHIEKIRIDENILFFVNILALAINIDIATCNEGKQLFLVVVK